jgi:calcineurin-like phosphoesterase
MKILAIGDLVGDAGLKKLSEEIKKIKEENNIDFTIVNGENVADGMGITKKHFEEMLKLGVDVVTMGNHTWGKKDIFAFIDDPKLIRPANYPNGVCGKGYNIYNCRDKKIAVINLIRKN